LPYQIIDFLIADSMHDSCRDQHEVFLHICAVLHFGAVYSA
jgi:hypothetical protein